MPPARSKLTSKGQMTLPKVVRDKLGVGPGDELEFVEERGEMVLRKHLARSPFDRYMGYLAHQAGADPDDVVRELRGHPAPAGRPTRRRRA